MGDHANDAITVIALAAGVLALCAIARRTSHAGPIARDELGQRYRIQVAITPEDERVVVAERI